MEEILGALFTLAREDSIAEVRVAGEIVWPGMRRAAVVVMDACGVGELPDAAEYGDAGSNTLGHLAEAVGAWSCRRSSGSGWDRSSRSLVFRRPPIRSCTAGCARWGRARSPSPGTGS